MPVTRSSRHGSRQPLQPQPTPTNIEHEVIVLSSDDDEPAPRKRASKKSVKPRSKASLRPVAPPGDVVEITSEEDSPHKNTILELQKQLDRAKRVRT